MFFLGCFFIIQLDRVKAIKALMSGDHRRQSITASKKRRPSLHLERRGTIRSDSKLPLLGTGDGQFERKREDSISEGVTEQKDEGKTDQSDIAATTEQGPPTAPVFPDQQTPVPERERSEVPVEASEVFDSTFVKKSKWSTLGNFVHSLQPHKGGGCSHVVNEVKHIAEDSGEIPSEDQVKEQVKVMAQHAIDSESIVLFSFCFFEQKCDRFP